MNGGRPWALIAAAVLAALEAATIIAVLAVRGRSAAPLLIPMMAAKFPFCVLVVRRSPTAWFGLLLWEIAGMLAAVTAPSTPLPLRLVELAVAGTVVGLLAAASSLFPTVRLTPHDS
ncbi:MAG TPA: hypothetical protein VM938_14435 [Acidimicrobiales bacterium]|nr:hypothetical protein [Acidimicrobiales bacterium]